MKSGLRFPAVEVSRDVEMADAERAAAETADMEVADAEMADVEVADVEMADVEVAEGVAFLLQLALDRTAGCSILLCFWWNGC